jgi:predicted nucleotide-binding protein (sugar kinase/HSP70/actin superfamily)
MKLTFPHMGNLGIAVKTMFEELGVEVIVPPLPNKRALELGVKYSPEFVCLPFKVTLGNFIEALQQGADVLAMVGGFGPCRLGYYSTIQNLILKKLGFEFDMQTFEPRVFDYLKKLIRLSKDKSLLNAVYAFWFGWKKLLELEKVEYLRRKIKPFELNDGETDRVYKELIKEINQASTFKELKKIKESVKDRFFSIRLRKERFKIKIGIVGEIYVVLEPFVNLDIIKKMTLMCVEVDVAVGVSPLIKQHLSTDKDPLTSKKYAIELSHLYLNQMIGGEGNISVGKSIIYAKSGYDGVIHIMPFTCSPENMAKAILSRVSKDYNIPIMSLVVDEHTQDTGLITRIEAFIELVKKRKRKVSYDSLRS